MAESPATYEHVAAFAPAEPLVFARRLFAELVGTWALVANAAAGERK